MGYIPIPTKYAEKKLTLYISAIKLTEDKLSNCLPAPKNKEVVIDLRMYLSKQDVLNGNWVVRTNIENNK